MNKWLPAVNKQKLTQPPKPQGGVAIGGVAVEAEFVIYINILWWICRLLCVSEGMLHWFTYYIHRCLHFKQNTVSKWAVCWPYWYDRGGGVNIVLFISGSRLWTCVYTLNLMLCSTGSELNIAIPALHSCVIAPTVWEVNKLPIVKQKDFKSTTTGGSFLHAQLHCPSLILHRCENMTR